MKPKIVRGLPETEYHADETTLSASGAKTLLGAWPPEDSDTLRFGTLVHVTILEPERLAEYVVLDPQKIGVLKDGSPAANPKNTTAWREAVAQAEKDGLNLVSQDDLDRAAGMRDALLAHPTARHIIEQATDAELSVYADHPTGARVRARFDLAGPIVGDIKTTDHADPARFGRKAASLGYHVSAANYLDIATACGMEPHAFAFLNVEKRRTPGGDYRVSVTELSTSAIDLGRSLMAEACRRWLALGKRIDLPSYGDGFSTVDLPGWAYTELPLNEETAA